MHGTDLNVIERPYDGCGKCLGPWLRDESGPYGGLVAAAGDRLGHNVVGCLNTGYKMRDGKKSRA